ncbi:MAG: hypothetical protein AABY93_01295 [Bacteroidota bacterium]
MKSIAKIFVLLALLAVLLTYSSCDNTKPPTPSDEEVQLGKLSKTWKATSTSVTKDGVVQTGYDNFTLTLSGTVGAASYGYTTSGRPALSPWLSSGSWTFDTDPLTSIIRDKGTADELKMTYTVTEATLQITYNFQGTGYAGRVDNVKGQWVMTLGL